MLQAAGLCGEVIGIPDDLSHGPLHDGVARMAYFRACLQGFADWRFTHTDAFAPWHDLLARLVASPAAEIVVWAGENGSEVTFLAMACHRLAAWNGVLARVALPAGSYAGQHTPARLAALYPARHALSAGERASLGTDFVRIRDETGLVRDWADGRVIGVAMDHYDPLLLRACTGAWSPAARIIGAAMAVCEPANRMSDLFFWTRLRALIAAGYIDADAQDIGMRQLSCRTAR